MTHKIVSISEDPGLGRQYVWTLTDFSYVILCTSLHSVYVMVSHPLGLTFVLCGAQGPHLYIMLGTYVIDQFFVMLFQVRSAGTVLRYSAI